MTWWTRRTEHGGPKNSGAKGGFWGPRAWAKSICRTARRQNDKEAVREGIFDNNIGDVSKGQLKWL